MKESNFAIRLVCVILPQFSFTCYESHKRFDETAAEGLVIDNMLLLPTTYCAVQWAVWKGGELTSRERHNRSEKYLLLAFLLVLLLVSHSVNQYNGSISGHE